MPEVGLVIPTLNEAHHLPEILDDVARLDLDTDVVVVDGGSTDGTVAVAERRGVRVVSSGRGRAIQMNAGAISVDGAWLCFLHADVRLPPPARDALRAAVTDPAIDAAVWRLAIDAAGFWFRVIEFGALLRDRLGGLPYGDQGLLIRRPLFDDLGRYPEIPIMEDVALIRALGKRVALHRFSSSLLVSPRRWEREGALRGWLRNIALISAYLAGVSPDRLVRWYRSEAGVR